jgi:hypothetical protein
VGEGFVRELTAVSSQLTAKKDAEELDSRAVEFRFVAS